jgi:urease accessory protein
MELVRGALQNVDASLPVVRLKVERSLFSKRRWRCTAEDGREFGFDLAERLPDGAVVFASDTMAYVIEQQPEPVLEIGVSGLSAASAARLGWRFGNLHFQIEVTSDFIRVVDDPAVRQMLEREGIAFTAGERVFRPVSGGHQH